MLSVLTPLSYDTIDRRVTLWPTSCGFISCLWKSKGGKKSTMLNLCPWSKQVRDFNFKNISLTACHTAKVEAVSKNSSENAVFQLPYHCLFFWISLSSLFSISFNIPFSKLMSLFIGKRESNNHQFVPLAQGTTSKSLLNKSFARQKF